MYSTMQLKAYEDEQAYWRKKMLVSSGRFSIWFYGVKIDKELAMKAGLQDKADADARKASAERMKILMNASMDLKKKASTTVAVMPSNKVGVKDDDDDDDDIV